MTNPNDPIPAVPVQIPEVGIVAPVETLTELEVKERRPVTILAAFGIIAVSGTAVGGLVYDLVVNKSSQSLTQLGTLATLGLGGLLALSGTKKGE